MVCCEIMVRWPWFGFRLTSSFAGGRSDRVRRVLRSDRTWPIRPKMESFTHGELTRSLMTLEIPFETPALPPTRFSASACAGHDEPRLTAPSREGPQTRVPFAV